MYRFIIFSGLSISYFCAPQYFCDEYESEECDMDMNYFCEDDYESDFAQKDISIRRSNEMTSLISFQKSTGAFEISDDEWVGSVFEAHNGKFEDVRITCPIRVKFTLWLTALAVKILELKMAEILDLWELVAKKSKKYLLDELEGDNEQRQMLLLKAEEYINKM